LTEIAGLKSQSGINSLLRRSVHRIWPHVDEAIKQEYPTPEQAFASRASIVTPETRRRMRETPREAWKIEKPRQMRRESIEKKPTGGKGKSREFSEVHKQNLIKANERRNEARQAGTYTGKPLGRPRR
jgi:hypothetical protein